jgi:hypothetical protein
MVIFIGNFDYLNQHDLISKMYKEYILKTNNAFISITSAEIGILITYLFQLSNIFQYCLRLSSEVEASMISTERVKEYIDLDHEKYDEGSKSFI